MQADETMTKQESEEMIKQLEKVFDIVRLLDERIALAYLAAL